MVKEVSFEGRMHEPQLPWGIETHESGFPVVFISYTIICLFVFSYVHFLCIPCLVLPTDFESSFSFPFLFSSKNTQRQGYVQECEEISA